MPLPQSTSSTYIHTPNNDNENTQPRHRDSQTLVIIIRKEGINHSPNMASEKEELNIQQPEPTDQNEQAPASDAAPEKKGNDNRHRPPPHPFQSTILPAHPSQLANPLSLHPPGSMLSAPSNFGNAAGDKIQGTLGKVGGPVGKGLETIAGPVGGLVDPLVGGVFRAPDAMKNAQRETEGVERHNEDLEKPVAGKEQTAGNPLGLN